jgi:hypothetical protein
MLRNFCLLLAFCLPAAAADDWGPAQFLVGLWTGEGTGGSSGNFSFLPDLQGSILVRKSFAEYPASAGKPAFRHDDLMIVYREEGARNLRAQYWDNEGHVVAYNVQPIARGVVFESRGVPAETRYRLSYLSLEVDRVSIRFEIAPPGKGFALYLEATAQRQAER